MGLNEEDLTPSARQQRKHLMRVQIVNIILGIFGAGTAFLFFVLVIGGGLSYHRLKHIKKKSGKTVRTTGILAAVAALLMFIALVAIIIRSSHEREIPIIVYVYAAYSLCMVAHGLDLAKRGKRFHKELSQCRDFKKGLLSAEDPETRGYPAYAPEVVVAPTAPPPPYPGH